MKTLKELRQSDVSDAMQKLHHSANGRIIGWVRAGGLTRKEHKKLAKPIHFINTASYSGAIIALRDGRVALGIANLSQAGRGYIFSSLKELKDTL